MNSKELRQSFLDFFHQKQHHIVPSAPMVLRNDPTLLFTNAGMNQFKNIFLGNSTKQFERIANTQKCLRVSGKHNDLEEVGHDTYHHTMFEMLGNWSFGDYYKNEAIDWAWEYLVEVLKIDKNRLYATIFEGDKNDGLSADDEARSFWERYLPENRVLNGSKKDNFWEMGDTGPCGPCSEIHIDLRDDSERKIKDGKELVNKDHPLVIEIWNLVFIEYNRKADGKLESLPMKHVDTGMGFERLCMVTQNKKSNYDTDIFIPIINKIEDISGIRFRKEDNTKQSLIVKTAMRVIADHLRAISFAIADGQIPSNTGAGYVIRRILRRAVRYGYQSLNMKEPFIFRLVTALIHQMGDAFPELKEQKKLIEQVIREEEVSFHKTLEAGLKLIDKVCISVLNDKKSPSIIPGVKVFELYDTYGFPQDLTALIAKGYGLDIDEDSFHKELNKQKDRSRKATVISAGDWVVLQKDDIEEFIGYDHIETNVSITKYRKVKIKNKVLYHLVFNYTPFYAEGGGQVGDTGYIESYDEKIEILDTKQENNLIIHISNKLPQDFTVKYKAVVDKSKRQLTANNHTATHLLHKALKGVLGEHVEQKGSLVNSDHLRFDFSHFQKLHDDEIQKIENHINAKIRQNIEVEEKRAIPVDEASKMGAIALFGEKYGDLVRVIKFDDSIELCGGIHVKSTGQIGCFKIISESAIAAGVRRIEAITAVRAENYINEQLNILKEIQETIKGSKDIVKSVLSLINENSSLNKQVESFIKERTHIIKNNLKSKSVIENGVNIIAEKIEINNATAMKDLAFQLKGEINNLILILGAEIEEKANLAIMISDNLVKDKDLNANQIIRDISSEIQGGGGGQSFFATAGGKNPDGLQIAINKAKHFVIEKMQS